MSQTTPSHLENDENDDLLPEYNFDYSKAKKNRFAKSNQEQLIVTIDPDLAQVFKTQESVNHALRLLLSAIPK
jgi:hypothetical protein